MRDHASASFWPETSGDDLTPRPALGGSVESDVAVRSWTTITATT